MSTTLTPPPVTPPASGTPPVTPRSSSRVIAIIAICLGTVLVIGAVFAGVVSTVRSLAVRSEVLTAEVAGISGIDVDIAAAELIVVYGDVDDATLEITGSGIADWSVTRNGDDLVVDTDRSWWRGWNLFGTRGDRAVLTLPAGLQGIDASLDLSAGSITARGDFGELDLGLAAGSIDVTGSADEVDIDLSAGRVTFDLDGVRSGAVRVSAGSVEGRLGGAAPERLALEASAGQIDLVLPEGSYDVRSDVTAGTLDNRLSTAPGARSEITVDLAAGTVTLRSER